MKHRHFLLYSTLGGLALSTSGLLSNVVAGRHGGTSRRFIEHEELGMMATVRIR
ncbi:hypothetical protein KZO25_03170 [Halomonas sp. ANAO-440]|uniref:hypothetical protein n=1 Tax=Halomonas sp. ANAO-440 TaxID=2861360 RepID=UPI001CAA5DAC|nr:hypothetical protein [Halomonas sp. ANAO-440]MBZ0329313.1 hypothetical protein [Halomonas sp. ANAO-440]